MSVEIKPEVQQPRKAIRLVVWAGVLLLVMLCVTGVVVYLRSAGFEEMVRERVVAAIERATGGRVELSSFRWRLSTLQFQAKGLVIHGNESAGERPLVSIDQVRARLRVVSLLETRIDLAALVLERPQVHVIRYPDGSTNVPEPREPSASTGSTIDQLFDLAVGRTQVTDGLIEFDEQKIPLEFVADEMRAAESYSRLRKRYDVTLHIGKIDWRYRDLRDVALQGDLDFSLWRNRAQIRSLKVRSRNSAIDASGTVEDFQAPRVSLSYDAHLDLSQAAAIARFRGIDKGLADLKGDGSYQAGQYSSSGKLQLRELDYSANGIDLHRANAVTEFVIDNRQVQLKKITGHVFGGDFWGEAAVKNYATTSPAPVPSSNAKARPAKLAAQEGTVRLNVANISVEELSRTVSTRSFRLDRVGLQAAAKGTVSATWKDSISRGVAEFALDFVPPAQPTPGKLPVSGQVQGSYDLRDDSISLQNLSLITPGSQLQASGRMASQAALDLDFSTSGLGEVKGVLSAIEGREIPLALSGQATFKGKLSGKLRAPTVAGHLQASNVTYVHNLTAPPQVAHEAPSERSATSPIKIKIDSVSADVQYSPDVLVLRHAVASHGEAIANLDGSMSLHNGDFSDDLPFHMQAHLNNVDADWLQGIAGTSYPVKGKVNVALQATGTMAKPVANGTISLNNAEAYGRPIDMAHARFNYAGDRAEFNDVTLKLPAGTVLGSGSYDLAAKRVAAELRADDVELAKIPDLQREKLSTAGRASFHATFSGTTEQPVINGHLDVRDLTLNDENVGAFVLDAVTRGDQLQVKARSSFRRAQLDLDGTVGLREDMESDLSLQFSDFDIDPLLTVELKGHITGHSGVAGRAHLSGPLRQPHALQGTVSVETFEVEIEKIPVKNDGPLELTFANDIVTVKQFALLSTDSRFTLAGTLDLSNDRPLNLRLDGRINLALAQTFDPDLTSGGLAEVNAQLRGTLQDPSVTGKVSIEKGTFSNIDLPAALADVNGTLVFNQNRLEVEQLTGHVGGGNIAFRGYITYGKSIGFELTSQGNDIRFRYSGLSVTADQELKLQGTLKNATASGIVTITRFSQIPSADLTSLFSSTPSPVPSASSPLNNLHLDIRILSSPELTVQTSLAKLSGDADLRLRGTALHPILLGRVSVAQGDVKLSGSKYRLERGDIYFTNPVRIDPILDVEATTRVRDFDITIGLHGTMDRLVTTYRSDPPLSSDDIISLLAFGKTQTESSLGASGAGSGLGQAASSALLGAAINQTVSNRVSRLFGVSSIRINPAAGGPDNNPNARLTVEQQVSKDVTITYITNLARSSQQVIQFEYNISRDYTITAIRDENGVVSFDLLVRKRKN